MTNEEAISNGGRTLRHSELNDSIPNRNNRGTGLDAPKIDLAAQMLPAATCERSAKPYERAALDPGIARDQSGEAWYRSTLDLQSVVQPVRQALDRRKVSDLRTLSDVEKGSAIGDREPDRAGVLRFASELRKRPCERARPPAGRCSNCRDPGPQEMSSLNRSTFVRQPEWGDAPQPHTPPLMKVTTAPKTEEPSVPSARGRSAVEKSDEASAIDIWT